MTTGHGDPTTTNLISLAILLLIVVRFLFRELRERKLRVSTLWIRPGIVAAFTVVLIVVAVASPGVNLALLTISLVVAAVLGIVTGLLVARSTTFRPAGERGAVFAKGSMTTVAIWIGALVLRYLARFAVASSGVSPAEQLELNAGLLALATAAFVVFALQSHRAIDRLAPEATPTRAL